MSRLVRHLVFILHLKSQRLTSSILGIKIWSLDDHNTATLQQSIAIAPRFFSLALALRPLGGTENSYVLAAAGTKEIIQLYILDAQKGSEFKHQATLSGHEGW